VAKAPRRWFAIALAIVVAGFLFAWSGIYNVAASRGHFKIVEWTLSFIMQNSVETHALLIKAPRLDDRDLEILGASHFYQACAPCHGAPGQQPNATLQSALPPAPDVSTSASRWKDHELFWIVRNGIKYTGMPAWPSEDRDDEVWAVVAFLKMLPNLGAQSYKDMAIGDLDDETMSNRTIAGCVACHGGANGGPRSRLVPILHGQSEAYLARAMEEFANGDRLSGIMQNAASDLPRGVSNRLAQYYSRLKPPRGTTPAFDYDPKNGEQLATVGLPDKSLPACVSCHGADSIDIYPRLAGQSAAYMEQRLRRFRDEKPENSAPAAIMQAIAKSLSDTQIRDASGYFATQPREQRP
jgi:cytochrome c553